MKSCFITELKTFVNLKSVWLISIVFYLLFVYTLISNGNNVVSSFELYGEIIEEMATYIDEGAVMDPSVADNYANSISLMVNANNPNSMINNVSAMILGLGILFIPVVVIFYIGADYGKMATIKMKITYYSLKKVILAKVVVACVATISLCILAYIAGCIVLNVIWNTSIVEAFEHTKELYEVTFEKQLMVEPVAINNFKIIAVTLFVLCFYTLLVTFIVVLSKNIVVGIMVFFFSMYIKIPISFFPTNIIGDMIFCNLYQNEHSNFRFLPSGNPLSYEMQIIMSVLYFLIWIIGLFCVTRTQKN